MTKRLFLIMLCILLSFSIVGCTPKQALSITQQPASVTVNEGEGVSFSVAVSGGKEPYSYEWYMHSSAYGPLDDNDLTNGTKTEKMTIVDITRGDNEAQVWCVITDANGNSVESEKATITVNKPALSIVENPHDVTVTASSLSVAYFSFIVTGGEEPYTYQWYCQEPSASEMPLEENSLNQGTKTQTLTLEGFWESSDNTLVWCIVTDATGASVTSEKAVITVVKSPFVIIDQSRDVIAPEDQQIGMYFIVEGAKEPFTYQWYKDGKALTDSDIFKNTNGSYLEIHHLPLSFDGSTFYCIVTDANGEKIQSDTMHLTVRP